MSEWKLRFQKDPDECNDDMGWIHYQAKAQGVMCSDCGMDFRFNPPSINMRIDGEDVPTVRHRFYGVDKGGWLVGGTTRLFDLEEWVKQNNIDTEKPHGRRPTPKSVETEYHHGPFYVVQDLIDELWS